MNTARLSLRWNDRQVEPGLHPLTGSIPGFPVTGCSGHSSNYICPTGPNLFPQSQGNGYSAATKMGKGWDMTIIKIYSVGNGTVG